MTNGRPLLILGASARAAAHSAIRAGFDPICGDQFADADLCATARVLAVADYPGGLVAAAAAAPVCPWIYTGGLENHPQIVHRIAASRTLWGNSAEVLAAVRDPWHVARALKQSGLPACRLMPQGEWPPASDGRWLIKSLRGAGGRGMRIWAGSTAGPGSNQGRYLQEFRAGVACSAVFVGAGGIGRRTVLVGITRQLVGIEEVHAPPFAWCGNLAPIDLPAPIATMIQRLGECLAREFDLCGLFGCDLIVDDQQAWLTEVNPRYPASTELLEWSSGSPLLDWHRRACAGASAAEIAALVVERPAGLIAGKLVLYAREAVATPNLTRFISRAKRCSSDDHTHGRPLPFLADIPHPGTPISAGHPIATVYARGSTEDECRAKLLRRAAWLRKVLARNRRAFPGRLTTDN